MISTITTAAAPLWLDIPEQARAQPLSASDHDTTPEEQQGDGALGEEDAQSAIGVSMSNAHARLMSPNTPATEKAAAMDILDGGQLFDGATDVRSQGNESTKVDNDHGGTREYEALRSHGPRRRHSEESLQPLPSPWTASPKTFQNFKSPTRKQTNSKGLIAGPASMLADLNVKRFVSSFNMPSLPKTANLKDISLPSVASVLASKDNTQASKTRQKRSTTLQPTKQRWMDGNQSTSGSVPNDNSMSDQGNELKKDTVNQLQSPVQHIRPEKTNVSASLGRSPPTSISGNPPPQVVYSSDGRPLKRSTSDQSLSLHRVTSTKSSLGDDTRWEHVQEQVNSRMQAFKDTWQDSNFKLPSLPTLPNVNLNSLRPDFLRPRGASDSKIAIDEGNSSGRPSALDGVVIGNMDQRHHSGQKTIEEDGIRKGPRSNWPSLDKALETLTGDVVVLGGYRAQFSARPNHRTANSGYLSK